MCRFLIVKSKLPLSPQSLLKDFASMCQKSRTPDGDRQADGWGVAWQANNQWKSYKSLRPIWQDQVNFSQLTPTCLFLAHARSASFEKHKGILQYNQPYLAGKLAFVFNGMIRGVHLNRQISGKIGAQKIFSLVKEEVSAGNSLSQSLKNVYTLLQQSSRKLRGLNIGLADQQNIAALCAYQEDSDYFSLNYHRSEEIGVICSQPIASFSYSKMKPGETITF